MSRATPDPLLELLRRDALPDREADALRARLTDEDRARLAELDADDARILADHPPAVMAGALRRRAALERAPAAGPLARPALRFALPALAAAALAVAVVLPRLGGTDAVGPDTGSAGVRPGVDPPEHVVAKGGPRLLVYRRTPSGAEALTSGDAVHAGDELRLGFTLEAAAPGVLVSLDGRGAVTLHAPSGGTQTLPAGRTLLDTAYALDDAPRFERFILVVGPQVEADAVRRAALAIAGASDADRRPLPLPAGWQQLDFLVHKLAGPGPASAHGEVPSP